MRLLLIVPYTPNLIRVRPYQILRSLKQDGHDITLATLWSSPEERQDLAHLERMGIAVVADRLSKGRSLLNVIKALPGGRPLQADYCWHPRLAQRITDLLTNEHFDAIHVEHLRGALYGLHAQQILKGSNSSTAAGRGKPPVVWDSVDCISHLFRQASEQSRSLKGRLMTRLDLKRTQLFEGYLVNHFGHVVTTSQTDAEALAMLGSLPSGSRLDESQGSKSQEARYRELLSKIVAIPNGVNLDYFQPDLQPSTSYATKASSANWNEAMISTDDKPTIVFSGKMSYHANITAALYLVNDIMPVVWAQFPEACVRIVGKDPSAEVQKLESVGGTLEDGTSRVLVTGTVPDLRPYLTRATVSVAPVLYGAGIQNKVLEAMACGAPVIASTQAASGITAMDGMELLVAETTPQFADAICRLLGDAGLRTELSLAGRRYVEKKHSWGQVAQRLAYLYQN